jgi:hypothetical protein
LTISLPNPYHRFMDPKSSAQLDPKLQEAYNRVMGTPTGPATPTDPAAPAANPTPAPTDQIGPIMPNVTPDPTALTTPPTVDPTVSSTPTGPEPTPITPADPTLPTPTITPEPVQPVIETPTQPTMTTVENTASHAFVAKKGMKISPVILIVGGIVFLLVYTLVWVKVFNLSVPFINQ